MRRRSLLTAVAAAGGVLFVLRRRRPGRKARVDLYFEDGSLVSLEEGMPESEALLALARDALLASPA